MPSHFIPRWMIATGHASMAIGHSDVGSSNGPNTLPFNLLLSMCAGHCGSSLMPADPVPGYPLPGRN